MISLFFTYFRSNTIGGEVGFAGHYPGKIQVFDLAPGQTIMVQRDGFLFAQSSVTLDIAMVRRLGAGLLGGEGFILQKLIGPGLVFIHAGGDHVDYNLAPAKLCRFRRAIWWRLSRRVNYDIQMVGNIRTAIFGGEGLFLTTLTGPGRVILQSMTLERLRHELAPAEHRGASQEMSNPLGALSKRQSGRFLRFGRISITGLLRPTDVFEKGFPARAEGWFAIFFGAFACSRPSSQTCGSIMIAWAMAKAIALALRSTIQPVWPLIMNSSTP